MDPSEILARLGTDTPPTDAELADAYEAFGVELANAVDNRMVEEAKNIRNARKVIRSEQERRAELVAVEDAELAELAADLEADPVDDDDTVDEDADVDEPVEVPADDEVLDLSALRQASRNARARISADEVDENPHPYVRVAAVGRAQTERVSADMSLAELGQIFTRHGHTKDTGRHTLVSMEWDVPEGRQLSYDVAESTRLLESVVGRGGVAYEAVAAAGGICGPLDTDYSIPNVGSVARPIRDALPRFGAARGGIRFVPSLRPSLATYAGGVSIWTSDNDASPSSPAEKPCPHVDCQDECTAYVQAITQCLVVSNLQAKFSPEQWANALWDLGVVHARTAEQALLAGIQAGSVATTYGPSSGTIHAVLGAIDLAVAGIRSRERLADTVGFRVILDGWLRQALRSHFALQDPEGVTGAPGIGDAAIAAWFAARGVTPTFTPDDSIFAAEAGGALNAYAATTDITIFPEGTWLYLDGGQLDLGTEIVDSDLIAQNDREAFMETFEGVVKRTAPCDATGDDSLLVTVTLGEDCICEVAAG